MLLVSPLLRFTHKQQLLPAVSWLLGVPHHAGVVHHDDERPNVLSFDTLLLQSVSLQLQVMV